MSRLNVIRDPDWGVTLGAGEMQKTPRAKYDALLRSEQEKRQLIRDIDTLREALEIAIAKNKTVHRPDPKPSPLTEELTYKGYVAAYWDYIDATDGYSAALALDNLKNHVYLGLEPVTVKDGKWAWVYERDEKPPIDYCQLVIQILFFGTIIAGLVCSALGIR